MPFGLVNASVVFVRMMKKVVDNLQGLNVLLYIDDLLFTRSTINERVYKLEHVFAVLQDERLTPKVPKCKFLEQSVEYLGFEVTSEGIRPGTIKIEAVHEYKEPTSVHEVRQFCGLVCFFQKFIKSHLELTKPLTQLLKEGANFNKGPEQRVSFQRITEELTQKPILLINNPLKKQRVLTDANSVGLAGILL